MMLMMDHQPAVQVASAGSENGENSPCPCPPPGPETNTLSSDPYAEAGNMSIPTSPVVQSQRQRQPAYSIQLRSGLELGNRVQGVRLGKRKTQIGDAYQAIIPDLSAPLTNGQASESETNEKLLWDPSVLSESKVVQYLISVAFNKLSCDNKGKGSGYNQRGHIRDDEEALFTLLKSDFNVEEALKTLKDDLIPKPSCLTGTKSKLWTEQETQTFETGIKLYGKDLATIQQKLISSKTFKDVVEFYYFWKKTERRDVIGLKKEKILDTTDFMERFVNDLT